LRLVVYGIVDLETAQMTRSRGPRPFGAIDASAWLAGERMPSYSPVLPRSTAVASLATVTQTTLRIGAGLLFMEHGLQKMFGLLGGTVAPLGSQLGVAGVLELVGGILIVAGLLTRPVAAVLVAEMLVAYVQAHAPRGVWPIRNAGELALLYAVVFAYFAANGPGPFSLDAVIVRRREA
jgi:putative oxidoreductase